MGRAAGVSDLVVGRGGPGACTGQRPCIPSGALVHSIKGLCANGEVLRGSRENPRLRLLCALGLCLVFSEPWVQRVKGRAAPRPPPRETLLGRADRGGLCTLLPRGQPSAL